MIRDTIARTLGGVVAGFLLTTSPWLVAPADAQDANKPNIVFIMGDDIGWFNIGAYHQGMMAGRTPNLDRLAAEGMRFTDYYAEASCTAGRANFITGELPIRTGLTTVGQAGSPIGMPAEAPTIATALKSHGLRHRPVRQEPPGRPQRVPADGARLRRVLRLPLPPRRDGGPVASATTRRTLKDQVGPRNMVHSWATDTDDPTVQPRWGKVGKQKIEDAGTLYPEADGDGRRRDPRPRAQVHRQGARATASRSSSGSTRRACTSSRTSPRSTRSMRTPENGWTHPGSRHGAARRHRRLGHEEARRTTASTTNTIVVFTTDNGAENFTWPDGGQTPFAGGKGTVLEGGFRVPCIAALAGQGAGRQGRERHHVRARLVPDLRRRGRQSEHRRRAASKGKQLGDRTYKVHLDGYNQTGPDHRQGPVEAQRDLLLRRGHARRGADRRLQVPLHRPARAAGSAARVKVDWPILTNLRLDPFERTGMPDGKSARSPTTTGSCTSSGASSFVQQEVAQGRADLHRVPADAEGRELQPGGREGADRGGDRGR